MKRSTALVASVLTAASLAVPAAAVAADRAAPPPEAAAADRSSPPVATDAPHTDPTVTRWDPALVATLDRAGEAPVVVLVHGTSLQAVRDGVAAAGLDVLGTFEFIETVVVSADRSGLEALAAQPGITYLENNSDLTPFLDTAIEATRVAEARALGAAGGVLEGPDGQPYTGAGVGVAVVDSGVDATHPFFQRADGTNQIRRNLHSCTFVVCSEIDVPDSDQGGGHGTHVAGIVGGQPSTTAAGTPISGAAPGADLYAFGNGVGLNIIDATSALQWIHRNHADPCANKTLPDGAGCAPIRVVNESFGRTGAYDPQDSTVLANQALVADGIVVVIANGNDGGDGTTNAMGVSAQDPTPGVIAVSNYDDAGTGTRDGVLSGSSSHGLASDPATWPDLSAPGTLITSSCTYTLAVCRSYGDVADPYYAAISGTSMAAPHVAGVAAIVLGAAADNDLDLAPGELEVLLEETAHEFGGGYSTDPERLPGSSFDKGHGLVDTVEALSSLLGVTVPPTAPDCAAGADATWFTDPAGDSTQVVLVDTGVGALNQPALDLLGAGVAQTDVDGVPALELSIQVEALIEPAPEGSHGEYFRYRFAVDGHEYEMQAEWDRITPNRPFARLLDGPGGDTIASDLPIRWGSRFDDTGTNPDDTLVVTLADGVADEGIDPARIFHLPPGVDLAPTLVIAQRQLGVLTASADDMTGGCPIVLAGEPIPGDDDPADATLAVGDSYAFTGATYTTTSTQGCDFLFPACESRTVEVLDAGTLAVAITTEVPANDFDVYLLDGTGQRIGEGGGSIGTFDETVTAAVEAGRYTIVVEAFAAAEASFDGTATLR